MGETVGGLDKVFIRLADYYDFVRTMWTRLITHLIYPLIEYWAAIGVLALVAYIRSMFLPNGNGSPRQRPHHPGHSASLVFFAPIVAYFVLTRSLSGSRVAHELLLRVPVVGRVFRTLALARFCWSMEMMTDSGVNIFNALQWSMEATANGAFEGRTSGIIQRIKDGLPLSKSLEMSGLFPHRLHRDDRGRRRNPAACRIRSSAWRRIISSRRTWRSALWSRRSPGSSGRRRRVHHL